jgi:nicotinate-nucleotide pyrophosphorylase (carboxylating)
MPANEIFPDSYIQKFIENALAEDIGDGDHTSLACISRESNGKAIIKVKDDGVLAGLSLAEKILKSVDQSIMIRTFFNEGMNVQKNDIVIEMQGNIRSILKAERLLLNCMQRMSGIATVTRRMVAEIQHTKAKILDTRKTTPNFRFFEKWAVRSGGGFNHRFGLYDMILIKDNHIDACGSITKAIARATDYLVKKNKSIPVEIETRTLEEVKEVLQCGNINRIMLDNFSPEILKMAIELIDGKYETEASGGITLENVRSYAETGVDYLSIGALTHSYKSLDISLKIIL